MTSKHQQKRSSGSIEHYDVMIIGVGVRRRMKIVANAFGERAVLKLMYAALIRASESWRGIEIKPFETKQLQAVGAELDAEYRRRHEPTKTPSEGVSPSRKSSRNRT